MGGFQADEGTDLFKVVSVALEITIPEDPGQLTFEDLASFTDGCDGVTPQMISY